MKRLTLTDMHSTASKKGGKCLSKKYINNNTKLEWQCKNGHTWEATPSHIRFGRWCPYCAGLKKLTIEEMREVALERGGKCLSESYVNANSKLEWQCAMGHTWKAMPSSIKDGTWCPKCAGRGRTIEEMHEIAKKMGGKCLSKEYKGYKEKLEWQCLRGHVWSTTPGSIYGLKTWCPVCAGNTTLSLQDLQSLAQNRGGKCLSKKYVNVDTPYLWECSLGHRFESRFSKVKKGQWCPICSKSGISEEVARTTLEQMTGKKFPKKRPAWLRNARDYQMEFDGFCEELGVAFEYHGIQHFRVGSVFIKEHDVLKQRIKGDIHKASLAAEHGIKLIVLDYTMEYPDFPKFILAQAKELKIPLEYFINTQQIDLQKAYIRNDRLEEIKELVKDRNGKLVSNKWLGVNNRYLVHCNVCSNDWSVVGSELIAGAWCNKCARRKAGDRQRGNLQELIDYAKRYDGTVLSKTYVNAQSKYRFKCKNGHVFEAKFNNLKHRHQWCPVCEGRSIRKGVLIAPHTT